MPTTFSAFPDTRFNTRLLSPALRRVLPALAIAFTALWLTGCASLKAKYARPAVTLPGRDATGIMTLGKLHE